MTHRKEQKNQKMITLGLLSIVAYIDILAMLFPFMSCRH